MTKSETDIQAKILIAITALPGFFFRQNSGVYFTATGRPVRAAVPGAPDIMGVWHGRAVGIEVKTPIGRQSKNQRNFQYVWERHGGIYIIATSPESAVAALESINDAR